MVRTYDYVTILMTLAMSVKACLPQKSWAGS